MCAQDVGCLGSDELEDPDGFEVLHILLNRYVLSQVTSSWLRGLSSMRSNGKLDWSGAALY